MFINKFEVEFESGNVAEIKRGTKKNFVEILLRERLNRLDQAGQFQSATILGEWVVIVETEKDAREIAEKLAFEAFKLPNNGKNKCPLNRSTLQGLADLLFTVGN